MSSRLDQLTKNRWCDLKIVIKSIQYLKNAFPLVRFIRYVNRCIRRISSLSHKIQYFVEWSSDNPEHFDHFMDVHYQWKKSRTSYPMERGVFSSFALANSEDEYGDTLDLCSGDGFYTYYFYSKRSKKVIGIDFDKLAIASAKKNFPKVNIDFVLGDIRTDIPDGPFRNVVWDAGIEHFTELEISSLMSRIKDVMEVDGILSGYTIKEDHQHEGKMLHQHEYEFHSKEDLARFFQPHFRNVQIIETVYPERVNYYFYASNGELPFETDQVLTFKR